MDDFKKDIEKNKVELSNDNLTEFEIASIKKDMRKKVSRGSKKNFRKIAVATAGIALIGGGLTPVIAENIPFIKDIYNKSSMVREYKDYTQYLGKVKEFKGGTATLDNLIITRDKMMVLLEIKTDEKIPEGYGEKFYLMSHFDKEWDVGGYGHSGGGYRVDANTFMLEAELHWEGHHLKENEDISFVVAYGDNKRVTKFDLKANIGNALDDVYDLAVNKKINDDITLAGIDSTILATKLRFAHSDSYYTEGTSIEFYETILKVDDKYYFAESFGPSGIAYSNEVKAEYRRVNKEILENAKSIEAIIVENTGTNTRDENGVSIEELKIEYAEQDGIKYPKFIETPNGSRVKYSSMKVTDNKISVDVESDNIDPILFAKNLRCGSPLNTSTVSKTERGYNVTFDKVEDYHRDGYNLDISYYDFQSYDEMVIKDTVKIK